MNIKFIFLILVFLFSTSSMASENITLNIAGKTFTEQDILVDILALVLKEERPEISINKKKNLGGTSVVFEAVSTGDIDMYVEYSGTAYYNIFKQRLGPGKQEIHNYLKSRFAEEGLVWGEALGFNNTYAIMVRDTPENKSINKISDLQAISKNLRIAYDPEIATRPDGYDKFVQTYDLSFKSQSMVNSGLIYQTLSGNKTDVIIGYSTDGRIPLNNVKVLKDDLKYFPDYSAAVLIHKKTLDKHPWISKALSKLNGQINDHLMQKLNSMVDIKKIDSSKVAHHISVKKNWIHGETSVEELSSGGFWDFLVSKKHFLLKKVYEHLFITFLAFFIVALIGISLGIASYYNTTSHKIIFFIVNLCQTIPSLALFGILIPILGIGIKPSLVALILYSLLPIVRNTYTGLCEVEPSILETCEILGMNKRQILFKVSLPMSLVTITAGLRTSLVIIVGTATIASFIGAGGLGDPIFQGITSLNNRLILLGAIPSALLAILLDILLYCGTQVLLSPGLKQND